MTKENLKPAEKLGEEIARLEAEAEQLEGPAREPSWDELVENSAKYEAELEARERRRSVLPRILHAMKVKQAERRVTELEAELEPLQAERTKAYQDLETAKDAELEAKERRRAAYGAWGIAHGAVLTKEDHIKRARRELRELRGGR